MTPLPLSAVARPVLLPHSSARYRVASHRSPPKTRCLHRECSLLCANESAPTLLPPAQRKEERRQSPATGDVCERLMQTEALAQIRMLPVQMKRRTLAQLWTAPAQASWLFAAWQFRRNPAQLSSRRQRLNTRLARAEV